MPPCDDTPGRIRHLVPVRQPVTDGAILPAYDAPPDDAVASEMIDPSADREHEAAFGHLREAHSVDGEGFVENRRAGASDYFGVLVFHHLAASHDGYLHEGVKN